MTKQRLFLLVCIILTASGCRSATTSAWRHSPADIDARLAAIEQSRLADRGAATETRSSTDRFGDSPASEPKMRRVGILRGDAIVAANRAIKSPDAPRTPTATHTGGVDFASDSGTLMLGDLGDESDTQEPDLEFADTTAIQREEQYLRRPPLGSFWETLKRDVKHMPGDLWRDTKRVYTNPVNLVILGSAYGGALVLQESGVDDTVEDHYDKHHSFNEDWRDGFGAAGNPATHFALAGMWYVVGQQTGNEKTYEVGKTMFSALIINGLSTMAAQAATSDRAPNGEWGTFFSGHTSSSFVMASVLHEAYGHWVGIPLYGLASLVAVERLDDREHYFSDVAMGAVVGTIIGHSIASGRDPELFGWQVVPYVSGSGANGVGLMKSF